MDSRLRKRRRSASPRAELKSPTVKRQNALDSSPTTAKQDKVTASARTIRQRPTRDEVKPSEPPLSTTAASSNTVTTAPAFTSINDYPVIPPLHTDVQEVLVNNTESSERVNDDYPSQGRQEMSAGEIIGFLPQGASLHVKIQSLPVLDNLATQILSIFAKSSYPEIVNIATKPDSEPGKAYTTLKTLFNHAKKVYSQNEPFLSIQELGLVDNAHMDTIRKSNAATFATTVFGSQEVGFYHLNEHFLDTFVADGHQILKTQAQLLLDLKTQAYISAASTGERNREDILDDLFPPDLEQRLLSRRPGARQLAPSEKDFVQRARNRKKALLEEPNTEAAIAALPEKYVWEDFMKDVSTYISKNFDNLTNETARKTSRSQRAPNIYIREQRQQSQRSPHHSPLSNTTELMNSGQAFQGDDIADKAQRAAQFAMQGYGDSGGPARPSRATPQTQSSNGIPSSQQESPQQPQLQFHFENQLHPNVPGPQLPYFFHNVPYHNSQMHGQWHPGSSNDANYIPYPTQSAPTQVLYERARMAASSKASPSTRRTGHPSQRRPWTVEEENWLMAGLDRVKGPHWSQILAIFGPGGTINEVLKDRNQVQLKDKARNLKLFFLKSNIEVPYYLQFVTGELKTRAPAQAAKNEAKGKRISEEDRAHVEGVMALASAPQQGGESAGRANEANRPQSDSNNVDPNLDAMQHDGDSQTREAFSAEYITPAASHVAPSADMLTGRQGQYEQLPDQLRYPQYDSSNMQTRPNGPAIDGTNASGSG
ncbi:MAG: hypothetical protein Q9217_005751 [Psora testacea]